MIHLETRTRFATMNEFKYRESSSLLDNERVQTSKIVIVYFISNFWYVSAQSFIDQTREFAHYQYYFTHRWSRSRTERDHLERLVSRCQKSSEFFTFLDLKLIRTRNIASRFLIWLLLEITSKNLKNHYDRDFRI